MAQCARGRTRVLANGLFVTGKLQGPLGLRCSLVGTAGGAGLAFAVGLGQRGRLGQAVAAGFLGAVLGAVAFECSGAAFFPLARTGELISETWPSRLLARLLVTLGAAVAVALSLPGASADSMAPASKS